jgi:hypothetical protein
MLGFGDHTLIADLVKVINQNDVVKIASPLTDSVVKRVISNSMDEVTSPQKSSFASDREDRTRPMRLRVIESMATYQSLAVSGFRARPTDRSSFFLMPSTVQLTFWELI